MIRKILVYLTLFITTGLIVGDIIALINVFLGGEITARFILKVISILVVSGLIFGYYILDLKKPAQSQKNVKIFTTVSSLIVLVSIVSGFIIMGSPNTQRLIREDNQKVSDLQNIQWQIVNFWQQKNKLPENLQQLNDSISGFIVPVDTQNDGQYEYEITGELSFNLCAEFNLPSNVVGVGEKMPTIAREPEPYLGVGKNQDVWTHTAGRDCFERTIDSELYKPR